MMKKIILYTVITIYATACTHPKPNDEGSEKSYCLTDSLAKRISIDTVKAERVMDEISLSGKITVDEDKQVKVYPLASGRVQELKVALGDYVHEGQLLALVKSPDVAGILSDASTSKYDLAIAKQNLDATEDLYKSGISSEKDYLTAQKEYEKAQSVYNKSNQILKIYGGVEGDVASYYIKAPISGFIVEKKINEGMNIRSDAGDNLFTISDLKDVWALANVYETDIEKIKVGSDAEVNILSYEDTVFRGKINRVFNVLNPDTKVLNVLVELENPRYLLKPGMFARITVTYPENQAMLSVPSASVIFDDNKYYVLRYKGKCNIEMQEISIYKTLNGRTYINSSNLHENDLVITRNGLYIFTDLKQM